jgi:BASS family bile acid:Na+ symporter
VKVNPSDLIMSTLQVVLAPVALGLLINTKLPKLSSAVSEFTPFMSVLFVSLICGSISAANSGIQLAVPKIKLLGAIIALHSAGFLFGYTISKLMGASEPKARTISIETGMQNSALASVLAAHFPSPQLTALPGCISATTHSLIGSCLASLWRWSSNRKRK